MTDSRWYQDAIFYELRLRSFFDANGDGIGDFRGLTDKLDYLADVGVTALWLLPFYPSPMRDDGYDIADYTSVDPCVGTLRDFKRFLKEAHRRGLKVVTELVLNHTSDKHPWFQRARRAPPGSPERNFYVWSDDPKKYSGVRIIFTDTEQSNWTWDPVAKAYYWHRFFSHQPDLNFDNPVVQKAMMAALDFWLGLGVDGLRLDAVPYLYEREGTTCENLPETHAFLRKLRRHVDRRFSDRMLLAEANQWPEDAVAYFGAGDECHMAFHFPIMPRLFMALRMEDSFPILDILEQTPEIPEGCQWAIFLRNHDELTLEMVTDEERDFMNRAYAADPQMRINVGIRRRLAPLLENNRRRLELMNALLFSLPGTPVMYYGDEIGMGDNIYLGDRNGVRTPMQWSPDRNAGFSRANPQRLYLPPVVDPEYHYEAINVETQQRNPSSLLWWTKRLIALRKQFPAFGRGSFEPLTPHNRRVLAFVRRHEDEVILVVVNLSRFSQYAELDLSEHEGRVPVELFGRERFPVIDSANYRFTLGPHAFHWFSLESAREDEGVGLRGEADLPALEASGSWLGIFQTRGRSRPPVERVLATYLPRQRWFRSKSRPLKTVRLTDALPLAAGAQAPRLVLVEADFEAGEPELYCLILGVTEGHREDALAELSVKTKRGAERYALVDLSEDRGAAELLVGLLGRKRPPRNEEMSLRGHLSLTPAELEELTARPLGREQSNTAFVLGDRAVLKLLRRVELGESVELGTLTHLAGQRPHVAVPELLGHLELCWENGEHATLGILQEFVHNQGDAWQLTLEELRRFFELTLMERLDGANAPLRTGSLLAHVNAAPPAVLSERTGLWFSRMELLGQRTGELHLALANAEEGPFQPDRFNALSRRSLYQSLRNLSSRTFDLLRKSKQSLPDEVLQEVLESERRVRTRLGFLLNVPVTAKRIRVHGDLHLGQVLCAGSDFVIIDFEGEPARPLSERRRLRSPLVDVAGMLRSFHYAAYGTLAGEMPGSDVRREDAEFLMPWADAWWHATSTSYLKGYLSVTSEGDLLPDDAEQREGLLDLYVMEKALYEIGYELNHRPAWAVIPMRGLLATLG
ncbi:MAG: maltose alpha-D-glucosyltransferase [Polyangiaceae bacterium]